MRFQLRHFVTIIVLPLILASPLPAISASYQSAPAYSPSTLQPRRPLPASHGRRGLIFSDVSLTRAFDSPYITWGYSGLSLPPAAPRGHSSSGFASQLRNTSTIRTWPSDVKKSLSSGVEVLLSFDEPEVPTTSISPSIPAPEAAKLWKDLFEPYRKEATLVSPAVRNSDAGLKWLEEFLELLERGGSMVDAVAVKWIGQGWEVEGLVMWVERVRKVVRGRAPIWVVEIAAHGGGGAREELEFLRETLEWLDDQKDIERYAYAGVFPGSLVDDKGNLTEEGKIYNSQ